jgi:sodium/potassium-transporting ATPase subunit alpha
MFSEHPLIVSCPLSGLPQALSNIQMILICVVTDVLPALSLVMEQPEADLLLRKPRNRKKDRLVDGRLIFHAYFFIGVLESLTAMTGWVYISLAAIFSDGLELMTLYRAFYFGFQRNGVRFSQLWLQYGGYNVDPSVISELTNKAQSICELRIPFYVMRLSDI